jgi:hypothetical protein
MHCMSTYQHMQRMDRVKEDLGAHGAWHLQVICNALVIILQAQAQSQPLTCSGV